MDASQEYEKIFQEAMKAVGRQGLDTYVKTHANLNDSKAVDAAKNTYRNAPWLSNPALQVLARQALTASLGPTVTDVTPFPSMIWYGGATDTYDGHKFYGTVGDFVVRVLRERANAVAEKRCGWVVTPTTNTDGHRVNASTVAMHALNLDCDSRGNWNKLLTTLTQIDIALIAYQSGGWAPTAPKWHILIPLSQPFDTSAPQKIELWKLAYNNARVVFGALAELTGEGFDPTTETPSIPIFITERRHEADPPRQVIWQPGKALDIVALTVALPEPPEDGRVFGEHVPVAPLELSDERLEHIVQVLCDPMSKIMSDRRELYMALAGALLDKGVMPDDVMIIIDAVSSRCPGDRNYTAAEVASKHKEHVHGAQTTIRKWENQENYSRIGTIVSRWLPVAMAVDYALPDPLIAEIRAGLSTVGSGFGLVRPTAAVGIGVAGGTLVPAATPGKLELPGDYNVPVDLAELRKKLVPLRRKKLRSKKRDDIIRGVLVDRLLDGEALVQDTDDQALTGSDGKEMTRAGAIGKVMGLLAFKFPPNTHLEAVAEIIRPSISAMCDDNETPLEMMRYAETAYLRSLGARKIRDEKKRADSLARVARIEKQLEAYREDFE